MRLFVVNLVVAGLVLFGAVSASALVLNLTTTSPTTGVVPGDLVTVELRLDTQGETQITSVFVSVSNSNAGALAFVSGISPGSILVNFSTFEGVARVSQPVAGVAGDAPGRVRAANFATATPTGSGIASANQLLATLTYQIVGPGLIDLAPLVELGVNPDEVTVATASVAGAVGIGTGVQIITAAVPEPSIALLMGLGLTGLAAGGRCRTV